MGNGRKNSQRVTAWMSMTPVGQLNPPDVLNCVMNVDKPVFGPRWYIFIFFPCPPSTWVQELRLRKEYITLVPWYFVRVCSCLVLIKNGSDNKVTFCEFVCYGFVCVQTTYRSVYCIRRVTDGPRGKAPEMTKNKMQFLFRPPDGRSRTEETDVICKSEEYESSYRLQKIK